MLSFDVWARVRHRQRSLEQCCVVFAVESRLLRQFTFARTVAGHSLVTMMPDNSLQPLELVGNERKECDCVVCGQKP